MSEHIRVILSSIIFCVQLFYQGNCSYIGSRNFSDASISLKCMDYGEIENGNVTIIETDDIQILHFTCLPGYQVIGRPKIICGDGHWEIVPKPKCVKGCGEPPMLKNGEVKIENYKKKDTFDEGVTAIYKCIRGFQLDPPGSKYRVCQGGKWNGSESSCRFTGCSSPPPLTNGYFDSESTGVFDPHYVTDERIRYTCKRGYKLEGPSLIQCQASGNWSPDLLPQCVRYPPELQKMCQPPHPVPHVVFTVVRGLHTANTALAGTTLKASCKNGYRDEHSPCEPRRLQCIDGSWEGQMPNCVPVFECIDGSWEGQMPNCVPVFECMYPLAIPNANIVSLQLINHYPLGSSTVYTCLAGYDLVGNSTFKCKANGCWDPEALPVCHPRQTSHLYFNSGAWSEYLNVNTFLFISMVSTFSVMFILLSVCVVVVCRHHHHYAHHHHHRRNGATQPTLVPPPPDTDRVALIAFAESIQSVLPSYEEAMRMNGGGTTGVLNYRVHRPHWTMVTAQRNRNTRQVPSAGESMGSTDTMTVSEVSTNVTLDTVSSHTCSSGSQTASCRAICGSLASFDTNSALNTEGAPLLEENEMEEAVTGSGQNVHELDSGSTKLQPDIASLNS